MKALAIVLFSASLVMCQTSRNFRVTTFANLGSPTENNTRWCSNCQATAPCTGGGTGAYAYADGSAWNCTRHESGGGAGSVTSVAANNSVSGLTMTISNPSTTPTINLSGTPNIAGSNVTSGTIGTARLGSGTANSTTFLRGDQTWASGIGTVTSVGLIGPAEFTFGSAITGSGNLSFTKANQNANLLYAGPSSGSAAAPGFRSLVAADLPFIAEAKFLFSDILTANASTVMHGLLPKLTGNGNDCLRGDGSWVTCAGGGGGGDFSTNTSTSSDGEMILFSGTGGKTGKRSNTLNGFAFLTNGVPSGVGSTGTNNVVRDTSPTIITPVIASFASANHSHTNSAGGGQITLSAFSSTTGSGAAVGQTSPVLVTPNIGVASATSINGLAISSGGSKTLTIASGKTATINNSLAFAGTDGTTQTFQASDTIVGRSTTDDLSNKNLVFPTLGGNSGIPGTCTIGQMFRDTSVSPNAFYKCIATNTWGQELVSGTVGAVAPGNGGTGTVNPSGTITISGATSGSVTFGTAFASTPRCVLTPTGDPGSGVRWWVTSTTTAVTANTSASVTLTFNYICFAQ